MDFYEAVMLFLCPMGRSPVKEFLEKSPGLPQAVPESLREHIQVDSAGKKKGGIVDGAKSLQGLRIGAEEGLKEAFHALSPGQEGRAVGVAVAKQAGNLPASHFQFIV